MFPHLLSAAVAPAAAAVTITARFILSIEDRALSIGGNAGRRCALHNNNNNNTRTVTYFFCRNQYSSNTILL